MVLTLCLFLFFSVVQCSPINVRKVTYSTVGWVNLYKKFEIEKYTGCGKAIVPKNVCRNILNIFLHKWLADLHGFAWVWEYRKLPVTHTLKVISIIFAKREFYFKYFKFWFWMCCKNIFLCTFRWTNFPFFKTAQKGWKALKTVNFWKMNSFSNFPPSH